MEKNHSVFEIGPMENLGQYAFSTKLLPSAIPGKKFLKDELGCVDIYRSQMSVPTKDSMLK